jgi:hypothetical protein
MNQSRSGHAINGRQRRGATAIVEFALISFPLVTLVMGAFGFGEVLWAQLVIDTAAQEAVHVAAAVRPADGAASAANRRAATLAQNRVDEVHIRCGVCRGLFRSSRAAGASAASIAAAYDAGLDHASLRASTPSGAQYERLLDIKVGQAKRQTSFAQPDKQAIRRRRPRWALAASNRAGRAPPIADYSFTATSLRSAGETAQPSRAANKGSQDYRSHTRIIPSDVLSERNRIGQLDEPLPSGLSKQRFARRSRGDLRPGRGSPGSRCGATRLPGPGSVGATSRGKEDRDARAQ